MAFSDEQVKVIQAMISKALQGDVFHSVVEKAATKTAELFMRNEKFTEVVAEVFERAICDGDVFHSAVGKRVKESLQPGGMVRIACDNGGLSVDDVRMYVNEEIEAAMLEEGCLSPLVEECSVAKSSVEKLENLMEPILFPSSALEKKFPFLLHAKKMTPDSWANAYRKFLLDKDSVEHIGQHIGYSSVANAVATWSQDPTNPTLIALKDSVSMRGASKMSWKGLCLSHMGFTREVEVLLGGKGR